MGVSLANIDIGGVFGGLGTFAKNIREAITGKSILDPNKQAELLAQAAQIEADLVKAQTEINKIEAAHESIFVAGWRPFIGWVCGSALAYYYIAQPFLVWAFTLLEYDTSMPMLDTGELMTILLGMLGLGAFRSYDKKQKENSNGKS